MKNKGLIWLIVAVVIVAILGTIFLTRTQQKQVNSCLDTDTPEGCYTKYLQEGVDAYVVEDYETALEKFQLSALAYDNDKTEGFTVWRNIGNSYQELGQYDKAMEVYDELLTIAHQDTALVYLDYIRLYDRQKKYQEALNIADQAYEKLKDPNYLYKKAQVLEEMERYSSEIEVYEQLLRVDPDNKDSIQTKIDRLKKVHGL